MVHNIKTVLSPHDAFNPEATTAALARHLKIEASHIRAVRWISRSIDSRKFPAKIHATLDVYVGENPKKEAFDYQMQNIENAVEVHITGAGPAGYFAALELIEQGFKPVIFERGKDISNRKRDVATLSRNQELNPDSNYAFGEGGAGTFSDGKLYTRSKKKEEIRKVLNLFHLHGAQDEILYETHPHIGTDILPAVIENMRKTIQNAGGKVLFDHKVTNLFFEGNTVVAIEVNNSLKISVQNLILATGHSAHNIYEMLNNNKIALESKGFAMGVRIEHPQELINSIQYHTHKYDKWLPAATYAITQQINNRGVYSFCMCPGGIIVPATTETDGTVVNGMSNSNRNSEFANSGLVVEIRPDDFQNYGRANALSGLDFQRNLEQMAFNNGGSGQIAPAQRMYDFAKGRISGSLPKCSYMPGVISSPMNLWLPDIIGKTLQQGFLSIGKRIPGFLTNDALIVGVESRTSSPVRIPRDKETYNHIAVSNLYPCGEGAGYAGGIVSSAIDGILVARAIGFKKL